MEWSLAFFPWPLSGQVSLVKLMYKEKGWMVGCHSCGSQHPLAKKPCPGSAVAEPLTNTAGRAWLGMEKLSLCGIFSRVFSSVSQ